MSDFMASEIPLSWYDGHCHFDFAALDDTRNSDWDLAQRLGLRGGIIPGVSRRLSEGLPQFISQWPGWRAAVGLHPYWADEHTDADVAWLEQQLTLPSVVAVGECGMDRTLAREERLAVDLQWRWFEQQIDLAEKFHLPLVLHVRAMHDEVAAELRRRSFTHGGLVHAFSGSLQQAGRWIDQGFLLGVGGAMSHPGATRLRGTLAQLPLTSLLLETDAPDMRPAFLNRAVNSPVMIPLYGAILASLQNVSLASVAFQTQQNLYRIFPRFASI